MQSRLLRSASCFVLRAALVDHRLDHLLARATRRLHPGSPGCRSPSPRIPEVKSPIDSGTHHPRLYAHVQGALGAAELDLRILGVCPARSLPLYGRRPPLWGLRTHSTPWCRGSRGCPGDPRNFPMAVTAFGQPRPRNQRITPESVLRVMICRPSYLRDQRSYSRSVWR